jgi:hypothetical protein
MENTCMSNLIAALPGWTSPPFELAAAKRLDGSVLPRAFLSAAERQRMYELLSAYFRDTSRELFEFDLSEKDTVVLLRDRKDGQIQGFSTLMRLSVQLDSREVVAFFSGDTIVAQEFWGETVLSRLWSQTVFSEADRIRADRPGTSVYWYLICSGYKTWRFLPVFFREYYPHPEFPTPTDIKRLLDTLGQRKFGSEYIPGQGVVRFRQATPLREGVADITEERLRDPLISFFQRVNPGHDLGDELACLTEISRSNLTRAGMRMVGSRLMSGGAR